MSRARLITIGLGRDQDMIAARQRARQVAALVGLDAQDQSRVATAVSEVARNALVYAGGGTIHMDVDNAPAAPALRIEVVDRGPGIAALDEVLAGRYRSTTGMGLGLAGARRLMDECEITTGPAGTSVVLVKRLPRGVAAVGETRRHAIVAELARRAPRDALSELSVQNQELARSLAELRERHEELARLNRELEDTNRGVVALYAELDERAEQLRQADQMKSRFLSHMSHEFRTPLNAIVGLSRLLLRRAEVAASAETAREVQYIQRSAEEMAELVNDLLDLAKAEAGKMTVQYSEFTAGTLFAALRTMMRPLLKNDAVELIYDEGSVPPLFTDESKVAQIVRNLVSNALKFTEQGSVRVAAEYDAGRDWVLFRVTDTGIGIAPEHLERIFEEFSQVDSPTQRSVKGTGLGLPLCRQLAALLGGSVTVVSTPEVGSAFTAALPRVHPAAPRQRQGSAERQGEFRALLIDDEEVSRYLLRQLLGDLGAARFFEAESGSKGLALAGEVQPDLIFLDLNMPGLSGFEVLRRLRQNPATAAMPVVVVTAQVLDEAGRRELAGAAQAVVSKEALSRAESLEVELGPPVLVRPRYKRAELPGEWSA